MQLISVFLCLPDAAAIEAVKLCNNEKTIIILTPAPPTGLMTNGSMASQNYHLLTGNRSLPLKE